MWDIIYSSKLCPHMHRESYWHSRTQWDHLKILQQLSKQTFKGRLIWNLSNLELVWLGIFTQKACGYSHPVFKHWRILQSPWWGVCIWRRFWLILAESRALRGSAEQKRDEVRLGGLSCFSAKDLVTTGNLASCVALIGAKSRTNKWQAQLQLSKICFRTVR